MAISIRVLTKNPFNLLCSKQQSALRGLVMARCCSVLALGSKPVKFLRFLSVSRASTGRRLVPELQTTVILAGLGLVPWSEASDTGLWASVGKAPCICPQEAVSHSAYENCPFPFSLEGKSRNNVLSQGRAWDLLLWCQKDSPKIKHNIFTA